MSELFASTRIRAISLWQPWATAVAIGWKTFETRHWSTAHRGEIAIHAAKRWCVACRAMHQGQHIANDFPAHVPFGAIVALAEIAACQPVEEVARELSVREEAWGNYGTGRFAWRLENVRPLPTPLTTPGRQGFWHLTEAESAAVREQFA